MEDIIKEVLDRHKDGQVNLQSDAARSALASEINAVILDRINILSIEKKLGGHSESKG